MAETKHDGAGGISTITKQIGGNDGAPIDPATIAPAGDDFDPDIHAGRDKRNSDGTYTRKRGRKANGTGKRKAGGKAGDLTDAVNSLSNMVLIAHSGIATLTKIPEFQIDKTESDLLANALTNVLDEFDVKPDPKTAAVIGLITAAGTVYAPRIITYKMRSNVAKKDDEQAELFSSNVTQMKG